MKLLKEVLFLNTSNIINSLININLDQINSKEDLHLTVQALQNLTKKKKSFAQKTYTIILTVGLQLFSNIFLVYPLIILKNIYQILRSIFTFFCRDVRFVRDILNPIIQIIFAFSVLNVCWETFLGFLRDRDIYSIWFYDAFFLFFTKILIFTIIKLTKQDDYSLKLENICIAFDPGSQNGLILDLYQEKDDNYTIMDIPLDQNSWEEEYLKILSKELQVDLQSQRFNTFQNKLKNPLTLQYVGFQLLKGLGEKLRVHFGQFLILLTISLLKIVCCSSYIFYHFNFGYSDLNYIVTMALFNINEVYCLNIMLSNYDLRRKIVISEKINSVIKHEGKKSDMTKLLDLTSCESLETWDNTRRALYLFKRQMIKTLEYSYSCILLYYLFVANICIAAYGDIDLIFDEGSTFLNPLIVISSTFNFLFLNALLFFRLYFGTQFNSSLEDAQDNVQNLIGIYQDLSQMYDYNFTKKKVPKDYYKEIGRDQQDKIKGDSLRSSSQFRGNHGQSPRAYYVDEQEDIHLCSVQLQSTRDFNTCYDSIISKIKDVSNYYIEKRYEFQGEIFQKHEEKQLQKKMLKNLLKSLERIKSQIEIDMKQLNYQVFNLIQLDFKETLFTISIGLFTLIPEIIPRFIQQFKSKDVEDGW